MCFDARQTTTARWPRRKPAPLARCDARGGAPHTDGTRPQPGAPLPWLAYASHLALGRLLGDHLANHPQAPPSRRVVDCDSADALLEYTLQGLGVAWLPWSLAGVRLPRGPTVRVGQRSPVG